MRTLLASLCVIQGMSLVSLAAGPVRLKGSFEEVWKGTTVAIEQGAGIQIFDAEVSKNGKVAYLIDAESFPDPEGALRALLNVPARSLTASDFPSTANDFFIWWTFVEHLYQLSPAPSRAQWRERIAIKLAGVLVVPDERIRVSATTTLLGQRADLVLFTRDDLTGMAKSLHAGVLNGVERYPLTAAGILGHNGGPVLLLGCVGSASDREAIERVAKANPSLAQQCNMALARLGDSALRKEFLEKFRKASPWVRADGNPGEDIPPVLVLSYIGDKESLKALAADLRSTVVLPDEFEEQYRSDVAEALIFDGKIPGLKCKSSEGIDDSDYDKIEAWCRKALGTSWASRGPL